METRISLIIIFFLFTLNSLSAYDTIETDDNLIVSNPQIFFDSQQLSTEKVLQEYKEGNFEKLPQKAFSLGFDNRDIWIAFEVLKKNEIPIFLQSRLLNLVSLKLFQRVDEQLVFKDDTGFWKPLHERSEKVHSLRLLLDSNKNKTLYFIKVNSIEPIFLAFFIGEYNNIFKHTSDVYILLIFALGIVAGLVLYNLLLFFYSKEILYFYYVIYLSSMSFGFFVSQGYLVFLSESLVSYSPLLIMLTVQIFSVSLVLFSSEFFNLKLAFPRYYKLLWGLLLLTLVSLFSIVLFETLKFLGPLFFALLISFIVYLSIKLYINGFKPAIFFIIATGVGLVFTFMFFLFAIFPYFLEYTIFTSQSVLLGLVWDAIVLSFAFGYRFKILKEEKEKSEKKLLLKSRQNTLGELIGCIAHQWRIPLNDIGAITTNLRIKMLFDKKLTLNDAEESIVKIDEILKHLSETVETFQGFFSKDSSYSKFNVKKLIDEIIMLMNVSFKENRIKIKLDIDEKIFLSTNKNYLIHALLNILSNAKDVFNQREIENRMIKIEVYSKSNTVYIEVEDNAGGIKVRPIEIIFEEYSTFKGKEGIGLGLFITKELIENGLNASLNVLNTKKGAKFIIAFN